MKALEFTPHDLDVAARTVWGEARNQSAMGKVAVASVIRNRAAAPRWWGRGVAGVCQKRAQFSCWLPDDPNCAKCHAVDHSDPVFVECLRIMRGVLTGKMPDPTNGADHYHTRTISPAWAEGKTPCATIGAHVFYRLELPAPDAGGKDTAT